MDKIGVIGSALAAACCLSISAVVSVLSAVGLGFLLTDRILLPMLIGILAVTLWGLIAGYRRHREPWALALGSLASVGLFVSIYGVHSRPAAYVAVGLLGLATVLTVLAARHPRRTAIPAT